MTDSSICYTFIKDPALRSTANHLFSMRSNHLLSKSCQEFGAQPFNTKNRRILGNFFSKIPGILAVLRNETSRNFLEKNLQVDLFRKNSRNFVSRKVAFFTKNPGNFRQKIPRAQKARRLNDIFVPQIVGFRRKGGREFFVGFFDFAFYVIMNNKLSTYQKNNVIHKKSTINLIKHIE